MTNYHPIIVVLFDGNIELMFLTFGLNLLGWRSNWCLLLAMLFSRGGLVFIRDFSSERRIFVESCEIKSLYLVLHRPNSTILTFNIFIITIKY